MSPQFDFGEAIHRLKLGSRVARSGWNGKGMWLQIVPGSKPIVELERLPYIEMKTADNKLVPWLASQTDVLANDWEDVS